MECSIFSHECSFPSLFSCLFPLPSPSSANAGQIVCTAEVKQALESLQLPSMPPSRTTTPDIDDAKAAAGRNDLTELTASQPSEDAGAGEDHTALPMHHTPPLDMLSAAGNNTSTSTATTTTTTTTTTTSSDTSAPTSGQQPHEQNGAKKRSGKRLPSVKMPLPASPEDMTTFDLSWGESIDPFIDYIVRVTGHGLGDGAAHPDDLTVLNGAATATATAGAGDGSVRDSPASPVPAPTSPCPGTGAVAPGTPGLPSTAASILPVGRYMYKGIKDPVAVSQIVDGDLAERVALFGPQRVPSADAPNAKSPSSSRVQHNNASSTSLALPVSASSSSSFHQQVNSNSNPNSNSKHGTGKGKSVRKGRVYFTMPTNTGAVASVKNFIAQATSLLQPANASVTSTSTSSTNQQGQGEGPRAGVGAAVKDSSNELLEGMGIQLGHFPHHAVDASASPSSSSHHHHHHHHHQQQQQQQRLDVPLHHEGHHRPRLPSKGKSPRAASVLVPSRVSPTSSSSSSSSYSPGSGGGGGAGERTQRSASGSIVARQKRGSAGDVDSSVSAFASSASAVIEEERDGEDVDDDHQHGADLFVADTEVPLPFNDALQRAAANASAAACAAALSAAHARGEGRLTGTALSDGDAHESPGSREGGEGEVTLDSESTVYRDDETEVDAHTEIGSVASPGPFAPPSSGSGSISSTNRALSSQFYISVSPASGSRGDEDALPSALLVSSTTPVSSQRISSIRSLVTASLSSARASAQAQGGADGMTSAAVAAAAAAAGMLGAGDSPHHPWLMNYSEDDTDDDEADDGGLDRSVVDEDEDEDDDDDGDDHDEEDYNEDEDEDDEDDGDDLGHGVDIEEEEEHQ